MKKIPELLLPFIEDLANRALRTDRDTLDRLGIMDGKIICFQYQQQDELLHSIYMLPFAGGLRMRMEHDVQNNAGPDVTISGNLPGFISLIFGEVSASNMARADMQIRGDIKLGQQFKDIADKLDLDLAGQVARVIGDGPANRLELLARRWFSWKSAAGETVARDFAEFIQEERNLSPRPDEVEILLSGVDDLRSGVDRLAHRLSVLKEKVTL
jgi:ubiquinone biosynthesis protein UbiJ